MELMPYEAVTLTEQKEASSSQAHLCWDGLEFQNPCSLLHKREEEFGTNRCAMTYKCRELTRTR